MFAAELLFQIDEDAANAMADGAETIFPAVVDQLKKNPFTMTSQDGSYIAIDLNGVADAMAA